MTYELIDLWITLQPFTGSQRVAVAGVAAMTPPLLAAAGAADAAPKHISPPA
jgi:hypothetical protein